MIDHKWIGHELPAAELVSNVILCSGRVVVKLDAERCVRVEVQSANQFGQTKIAGDVLVALP